MDFQRDLPPRPVSPGQYEVALAQPNAANKTLDVYPDVRMRDIYDPNAPRRAYSAPEQEEFNRWRDVRSNRMRPIEFRPTGSFKALKETGKLVDKHGSLHPEYKGREKQEVLSKQFIPGYAGFVRGGQHISGRTYGETTRRALSKEYEELVKTSPVPSDPETNRKIIHEELDDTFVSNTFSGREYHVPGYTGFVPGVRATYSMTYGTSSAQELSKYHRRADGCNLPINEEPPGQARPAFSRKMLDIDSAPLPGHVKTQRPPEMHIPGHLKYLRYFAM